MRLFFALKYCRQDIKGTQMRFGSIIVGLAATIALGACGGGSDASSEKSGGGESAAKAGNCPPVQKGDGILASSRFDYEDLLESNSWRDEMFSKSCAGSLGAYVPDMPEGYGLVPTVQPYIMNEDQVYLAFGEIPEPRIDETSGQARIPMDMDRIDVEIRRFSADELSEAKTWLAANPGEYFTAEIAGETVYLVNGMGFGRMGKGDKMLTALQAFLDNGVVLRVNHKSIYNPSGGVNISPLVERVMSDMLNPE